MKPKNIESFDSIENIKKNEKICVLFPFFGECVCGSGGGKILYLQGQIIYKQQIFKPTRSSYMKL